MTIWKRSDGSVALDWESPGGPFVVLRADQFAVLCREIKRIEEA